MNEELFQDEERG